MPVALTRHTISAMQPIPRSSNDFIIGFSSFAAVIAVTTAMLSVYAPFQQVAASISRMNDRASRQVIGDGYDDGTMISKRIMPSSSRAIVTDTLPDSFIVPARMEKTARPATPVFAPAAL